MTGRTFTGRVDLSLNPSLLPEGMTARDLVDAVRRALERTLPSTPAAFYQLAQESLSRQLEGTMGVVFAHAEAIYEHQARTVTAYFVHHLWREHYVLELVWR